MPKATKASKPAIAFTLSDFEKMLRSKKLEWPLAGIAMRARYSAAAVGIFDFPADAEFYRLNIYAQVGNDKKARKIVLDRILEIKKKKGKILYGEDSEKAEKVYRAAYRKWIKSAEAKAHPKYKKIKAQMSHYEDIVRTVTTPFDTEAKAETPFDELTTLAKKQIKKAMKRV